MTVKCVSAIKNESSFFFGVKVYIYMYISNIG